MKKLFNFIKNRKDDNQSEEEVKHQAEEDKHSEDDSTKDKDSHSDEANRDKLEEIKRS